MLTPMDIHNKEFKRGFRGYSEEDVDTFMNNIAGDYEKVYREYCELKERCDSLQDKLSQYEKMEATMNSTLMLAQQTAENVKVSARKEADLILQEAESKKQKMLDETMRNLQQSQQEWEKIKARTEAYRAKCRALLTSQLRLIDDMALDGDKAAPQADTKAVAVKEAAPAVAVSPQAAKKAK
ncbi:DivIVA domain-containing protein [Megasphaera sp.]|uniref:DivIVA domain-containing protein n=1 Tax=Megasphaera sp. TaxID=2023260 RepID=UPI0028683C33|nr:DivIVA domain-containing protein [uncultured Megasphaera sp.]